MSETPLIHTPRVAALREQLKGRDSLFVNNVLWHALEDLEKQLIRAQAELKVDKITDETIASMPPEAALNVQKLEELHQAGKAKWIEMELKLQTAKDALNYVLVNHHEGSGEFEKTVEAALNRLEEPT